MQRMKWIDTAKGIAIILVVIGHVVSSYQSSGMYLTSTIFNFSHDFVYSFHMASFMILSGILFSCASENKRNNSIISKIINYGIPYIAFSIVWWLFKVVLASHTNTPVSISDILLIPIFPISFMWYIYALLIMNIIQMKLPVGAKRKYRLIHMGIALILLLSSNYLCETLSFISFEDLIICDIFKHYLYFLIGVYYARKFVILVENSTRKLPLITSITGCFLLVANILLYNFPGLNISIVRIIVALIGSAFLIMLSHIVSESVVLNYLGKNSLAIYVLHSLAIAGTRSVMTRLWNGSDLRGWLPLVICSLFGIILPLVAYSVSQKIWKLDFFFSPGKYIHINK